MHSSEGKQKTDRYAATSIIPSWPATAGGGFLQLPRSPLVIRDKAHSISLW